VEGDQAGDASSHSFAPLASALSDFEKAEAVADSVDAEFRPVDDLSDPAFTEMFREMRAYEYAPASEPTLIYSSEVLKANKGLKAPGPDGIPNRVLRHLPKHAITFLAKVFNAVPRRQYFPPVRKHARVVATL
jgi:hypothetical protein